MKRLILCSLGLLAAASTQATPVFSDTFDTYTAGNLVGQGPWLQTSTSATSPVQVSNGKVSLGSSGQDVYAALPGGLLTLADGTSFYMGLNLNVSIAQATGDYFLHFTPTVGDSSLFYDRLFVKQSGSGYVLGWLGTAGTGSTIVYGATALSLNTDYRVVVAYHGVAGTQNDTASIYVGSFADPSVEGNNTAYLSGSWTGPNQEPAAIAGINLRQGSAANAPTLTVDDLNASQTFSDVTVFTPAPVPEPQSLGLLGGFALLAWNFLRRRK